MGEKSCKVVVIDPSTSSLAEHAVDGRRCGRCLEQVCVCIFQAEGAEGDAESSDMGNDDAGSDVREADEVARTCARDLAGMMHIMSDIPLGGPGATARRYGPGPTDAIPTAPGREPKPS